MREQAARRQYAFDNVWIHARQRLDGLEQLLDPGTIRHLEALGVAEGWRCLEVGAGGGSVTTWLCQRAGSTGHVTATDLDTRFLDAVTMPNLDIRRHDIVTDELPEMRFDLVLSRLVLEHIQQRETALRRMLSSLKPGGWLVCEDTDSASVTLLSPTNPASRELFARVERAKDAVLTARGHAYCGRQLYGYFCALGLERVRTEGRAPLIYARTAPARWKALSVDQIRTDIVGTGLATDADIDGYLALVDSQEFVAQGFTVMTAWGRRPGA